ncbi:MAG: pyruvate dehydrogenase (acetyl-transferring), homodimeric type [Spirochaetales bacterium]|nr:pyruvate dehydrogenase (acetyl-transferring), homodimeric type [Spirochaetales bacterium]
MEKYYHDPDSQETSEWLDSLDGVIRFEGSEKTDYLLRELTDRARSKGVLTSPGVLSPYMNTIPPDKSAKIPEDSIIAKNVSAFVRWNAMAMVVRANKEERGLGGHIASFSSAAILYEVGFNWFFRGPDSEDGADMVFFQGHSSPGIYARAFVEGRLSEEQLVKFRQEVGGDGLSSYPHPWLMPDFWQFPTVSMGLGPLMAVYQARFMKYMNARELSSVGNRKVWVFMGDGESDEPESQGALALAAREKLDNLIYVVNCNLQRLDGPVRGNGKIIQELEGNFRGAGWNVIKVIWGSEWDDIMERDTDGLLLRKFSSMVDGEFQTIRARGPAYLREHVFGSDPRLLEMVKDKTDDELWQMSRGGHDPRKVFAAFSAAREHKGQPTVILVKTVKGLGMGPGEASMGAHNVKNLDLESLKGFRDRFDVPLEDNELEDLPFIKPEKESPEYKFLKRQRSLMGGAVPIRTRSKEKLKLPEPLAYKSFYTSSGERELSTTMAFVRLLGMLSKDKNIGERIVPIVPDEARTFGMEGLFRQMGIYAPEGQLYEPQDSEALMWYREDVSGQILEEGINEAGAFSSWISAGTAYSNYGKIMIPFYTFYSIFGFQRIGDLAWAAGDSRAKGFLMGATAGRTTLNGEGLQHQDGHGLMLASTLPTCKAYDPAFSFELAVIIQNGLKEMYEEDKDLFYYITLMNENYVQPQMPEGVETGIINGVYKFKENKRLALHVNLMGSGTILNEVIAASDLLKSDFNISSDIWSIPGVNQLHRDGIDVERWNIFHSSEDQKVPYLTDVLSKTKDPVVISTDYIRAYPEQIRRLIPNRLIILGTDGYGRSDMRNRLRDFFEIDRYHIVLSAVKSLSDEGMVSKAMVDKVIEKYKLDINKENPLEV